MTTPQIIRTDIRGHGSLEVSHVVYTRSPADTVAHPNDTAAHVCRHTMHRARWRNESLGFYDFFVSKECLHGVVMCDDSRVPDVVVIQVSRTIP